jgi:hypothetical protein
MPTYPSAAPTTDNVNSPLQVGGGAPMDIQGNITLCAVSDLDPNRFYDGRLADLSIYDRALTPLEVTNIYQEVRVTFCFRFLCCCIRGRSTLSTSLHNRNIGLC